MTTIKAILYYVIWLWCLNPAFLGLVIGALIETYIKSLALFLIWILACFAYYHFIWMPVRKKFHVLDKLCVKTYTGGK